MKVIPNMKKGDGKTLNGKGRVQVLSYVPMYIKCTSVNDWSKVTYLQVHGSSVLKNLSFQSF